jgi:hypothetical protein
MFVCQNALERHWEKITHLTNVYAPNNSIFVIVLLFGSREMQSYFGRYRPVQDPGGQPMMLGNRESNQKRIRRY